MLTERIPEHYLAERQEHAAVFEALEQLGRAVRAAGPIDAKHGHLMQMAAAIAIGSEGATHSHVRRAIEAGATPSEVIHSILLLTCTVGYPTVSKALSWAEDIIGPRAVEARFDA
jgi:alkylhydroperoxidase/carboxymuconolactone decarboxylase family protein YurZ